MVWHCPSEAQSSNAAANSVRLMASPVSGYQDSSFAAVKQHNPAKSVGDLAFIDPTNIAPGGALDAKNTAVEVSPSGLQIATFV